MAVMGVVHVAVLSGRRLGSTMLFSIVACGEAPDTSIPWPHPPTRVFPVTTVPGAPVTTTTGCPPAPSMSVLPAIIVPEAPASTWTPTPPLTESRLMVTSLAVPPTSMAGAVARPRTCELLMVTPLEEPVTVMAGLLVLCDGGTTWNPRMMTLCAPDTTTVAALVPPMGLTTLIPSLAPRNVIGCAGVPDAEMVAAGYVPGSMMTVCPGWAACDAAPIVQNGWALVPLPAS